MCLIETLYKRQSLPLLPQNLDIIKQSEGLRLSAYQDIVGIWTIGYGSTYNVKDGDVITEQQACDMLLKDIKIPVNFINNKVKVKLYQNEFDALLSLVYNIGVGNFGSSTLLKTLNQELYKEAADQFLVWRKAGGKVVRGLEIRRAKEQHLFLS